jgi:hypothetical protein
MDILKRGVKTLVYAKTNGFLDKELLTSFPPSFTLLNTEETFLEGCEYLL